MDNSLKKARVELLLLFALYLCVLPSAYMEYDMGFWREWAVIIHRNGLSGAYNSSINYFPVYIYGLYLYDLLQGTEANIIHHINSIKILFVAFDFLPLVVLCAFRQRLLKFNIPYLFLLLNIAYIFNSMVWGQIDSIYTNLAFLAIVVGACYPVSGTLLYLLALNTKQQAIVFLPVMAIVLWFSVRNFPTLLKMIAGIVLLQLLLLLPFLANDGIGKMSGIITHTVDLYHNLSICAFNFWYMVVPSNPYLVDANSTWFIISYKTAGMLLFCTTALLTLIPLFKHILLIRRSGEEPGARTWEFIFLAAGMLCLYFFYFNAQMHERYAHPIIIFFFFYGAASGDYRLYILASIPYFLSLDKCFPDYLPIVHYKIIYASRMLAGWYTATVIYGSCQYYKLSRKQQNNQLTS